MDNSGDAQLLSRLFGNWHPAVAHIASTLEDANIDRRALYDSPPLRSVFREHTVVIGDAAHAMAANAGGGACEALVDAIALADSLREAATLEEGLRAFDQARRRTAQRVVRVSRILNRLSTARRFSGTRRQIMNALSRLA